MSFLGYVKMDIISEIEDQEDRSPPDAELWRHIREMLAARTHRRVVAALPPLLGRADLRATFQITQWELAERLGLTQARVSRIERHPNPHIALLRSYIEGLGGTLHLLARFDKGDFRVGVPR